MVTLLADSHPCAAGIQRAGTPCPPGTCLQAVRGSKNPGAGVLTVSSSGCVAFVAHVAVKCRLGPALLRSRRSRVRRQQERGDGDDRSRQTSGVPLGGACAFEHGDLATGAATVAATY
ncbi:DUF397 domain-containing protein [Streptomyces sp. WAC04114]|nr:DUF397 domain-containing protein [Streptomyces sp. WAC04114]